jgi:cell division septum initiation protein DivIVA
MPIKPEEIDPSKLPVSLRGYDRQATDELLKRVAWDYRQALRVKDDRANGDRKLAKRVEELEARLAAQQEEFAKAIASRESRVDESETKRVEAEAKRVAALEAEIGVLRRKLQAHETRDELTRAVLRAAQRAAREMRESAREDARALLKAARRRALQIERDASVNARRSSSEIERLRRLESDLRDRLRSTLESVIGGNGNETAPEPSPEHWPTTSD